MKAIGQPWYLQPSLWLSLVAVLVSAGTFYFNHRKDVRKSERDREQSIQDDFWMRSVAFPNAIEPVITFCSQVMTDLPEEDTGPKSTYFPTFHKQQRDLANKATLISALWPQLSQEIGVALETLEDAVAEYCGHDPGDATKSAEDHALYSRAATVTRVSQALTAVVAAVQGHQKRT